FAGRKLEGLFRSPEVHIHHGELESDAARLGNLLATFGANVDGLLRTEREAVIDQQYQQGRIADAAIELYVSACVVRRLDAMLEHPLPQSDGHAGLPPPRGEGRGEGAVHKAEGGGRKAESISPLSLDG